MGYRNDKFFSHTNPYISNVTQQCPALLVDAHISSLGYLWGTQQSILREGSAPRSNPCTVVVMSSRHQSPSA